MSDTRPPAPISLSRLRPVATVLGVVVAALVLTNLALLLVFGPSPETVRRAEVLDPGEYQRIGEQLAATERELTGPNGEASPPLAVVVGLSTAREDIDATRLGASLCDGMRVLNLGSSGGSYRELAYYLRPLRRARLRSALTIVAVHPVWLAGRVDADPARERPDASAWPGPPSLRDAVKGIGRRWGWLFTTRRGMHAALLNALWDVRVRVASEFGLGVAEIFPDGTANPWAPRIAYQGAAGTDEFRREQLAAWRSYGWFEARRFTDTSAEAQSLRALLDQLATLGGHVVVVLLPEQSTMRHLVPASAADAFRHIVTQASRAPVLDFRAKLPDDLFFDYAHLNAAGRARLSTELGEGVSEKLGCR